MTRVVDKGQICFRGVKWFLLPPTQEMKQFKSWSYKNFFLKRKPFMGSSGGCGEAEQHQVGCSVAHIGFAGRLWEDRGKRLSLSPDQSGSRKTPSGVHWDDQNPFLLSLPDASWLKWKNVHYYLCLIEKQVWELNTSFLSDRHCILDRALSYLNKTQEKSLHHQPKASANSRK